MSERDHAIMEAHKITASDEYFAARPQLDCNDRRKVYEAGFQCAWTEAQAESAAEIADLRRQLEDARKDAAHWNKLMMKLSARADSEYPNGYRFVLPLPDPIGNPMRGSVVQHFVAAINAKVRGPEAALSPEVPSRLEG